MLVVHWTKHNRIGRVLKTGLAPQTKKLWSGEMVRGIWVYPFIGNSNSDGTWRRILKPHRGGANMNGIVFRLCEADFPCFAGSCLDTHYQEPHTEIESQKELNNLLGIRASRSIPDAEWEYEIILLNRVSRKRFIKTLKDRDTLGAKRQP